MRTSSTFLAVMALSQVFGQAGTLDPTFSFDGYVTTIPDEGGQANAVAVQSDGRIVVAGNAYDDMSSTMRACVMRYMPDGQLDLSFGTNGLKFFRLNTWNTSITAMRILDDDRIVLAGTAFPANDSDPYIARLLPDGDFDSSFSGDGISSVDLNGDGELRDVMLDEQGRLVGAGSLATTMSFAPLVLRLLEDGTFDMSFDGDGIVSLPPGPQGMAAITSMKAGPAGSIYLAGHAYTDQAFDTLQIILYKIDSTGVLDPSFGSTGQMVTGLSGALTSLSGDIHVTEDGGLVVVGSAGYNLGGDALLLRLLPNGTLDPAFGINGQVSAEIGPGSSGLLGVLPQADGRFMMVGGTSFNGDYDLLMARFNPDGSLDPSFAQSGVALIPVPGSPSITCMAVQPDLRLLVAGAMDLSSAFFTARLHSGLSVGLPDQPTEGRFVLYPNPCTDDVRLRVPAGAMPDRILVLDAAGRVVYRESPGSASMSNTQVVVLPAAHLPPGSYTMVVELKDTTRHLPFIRL